MKLIQLKKHFQKRRFSYPLTTLTLLVLFFITNNLQAQQFAHDRPWLSVIDLEEIRSIAKKAPHEDDRAINVYNVTIDLPMPGGELEKVRLIESSSMTEELQREYSEIRSYIVEGVNDANIFGRVSISPYGVEGMLFSSEGDMYIEPLEIGSELHKVYYSDPRDFPHKENDLIIIDRYEHQHDSDEKPHKHTSMSLSKSLSNLSIGDKVRKLRVSILTDGEYSQAVGGGSNATNSSVMAKVNATITGLNALYIRDMAVKLEVSKSTIYLDPNSDPFNNAGSQDPDWTTESAVEHYNMNVSTNNSITPIVKLNEYDAGHLFSGRVGTNSGGGGAALGYSGTGDGILCRSETTINGTNGILKAAVGSGMPTPQGVSWVQLIAHEFTHAFGASHTYSGNEGANGCGSQGQFNDQASYEPGGGSTIVSYYDICGSQNIPGACAANTNYYHTFSIQEVDALINLRNCLATTNSNNQKPTATADLCNSSAAVKTIPKQTPFEIEGTGSDPDGNNSLTFNWEQMDKTATQLVPWDAGSASTGPLFKSVQPSTNGFKRSFPSIANVMDNKYNGSHVSNFGTSQWNGEVLPTVGRTIKMRLNVRDNNTTSGGVASSEIDLTVDANAGPFEVTKPNGGDNIPLDGSIEVTWNKAGTDGGSINCSHVNILITTDNGANYSILSSHTPNDGTETINLANLSGLSASTTARIRIESNRSTDPNNPDCIRFFDISNADFTLQSNMSTASSSTAQLYTRDVFANEGEPHAYVTVSLTEPASSNVTFEYSTEDVSAKAGSDYTAASGTATIPVGQSNTILQIGLIDDNVTEFPKDLIVKLANADVDIAVDEADITILDNDADALCNMQMEYETLSVNCDQGADPNSPLDDNYSFTVIVWENGGNGDQGFILGCDATVYPYNEPFTIDAGSAGYSFWELATDNANPNCYIPIISLPPTGCGSVANCEADFGILGGENQLVVTGLNSQNTSLEVWNSNYQSVYSCLGGECDTKVSLNLAAGNYIVRAKYLDSSFNPICQKEAMVTVTSKGFDCTANYQVSSSGIVVNGYENQPHRVIKVFPSNFSTVAFSCGGIGATTSCDDAQQVITGLAPGEYWIQIQTFTDVWEKVCDTFEKITIPASLNQQGSNNLTSNSNSGLYFDFKIFPNPSNGAVTLNLEEYYGQKEVNIQMTNTLGSVVHFQTEDEVADKLKQLDLNGLNEGLYFITIQANGESKTKKLVIKK